MEASYTPQLSYGYYSPYIASVLDIARIFDSFRTAQYQYIPALATQQGDKLALTLNAPPSFHNPKSVLVVALPAVEQAQLPPLHAVDPKEIYCAARNRWCCRWRARRWCSRPPMRTTSMLTLSSKDGKSVDLPAPGRSRAGRLRHRHLGPGRQRSRRQRARARCTDTGDSSTTTARASSS